MVGFHFSRVHDDEYMSKKNYYGQAHDIREIVTEQASIMVNGKLKEYQVHNLKKKDEIC